MIINGERSLAYISTIDEIKPIEGYDRVEYARTKGWWVIVNKADNFKVGDKCIYIEVDSKVPEDDDRFKFLEKRNYRVKTLKMCKVISQGLILPISLFPELSDKKFEEDVSKELRITYADPEDISRKSNSPSADSIKKSHPKFTKTKLYKWMMRREWGRTIIYKIFSNKETPKDFPKFPCVKKTDEERVENMPFILQDKRPWVVTQKIDGTSATYILEKKSFRKFEYYVCSRNMRQKSKKEVEKEGKLNVYWEMSDKYNIRNVLEQMMKELHVNWICIQGEIAGPNIQGNPHKLKERKFYAFNFITPYEGRWGTVRAAKYFNDYNIPWVPILDTNYILPDDMEEFKEYADGECVGDMKGLREGVVLRDIDGNISFKNVSRKYLLKKK